MEFDSVKPFLVDYGHLCPDMPNAILKLVRFPPCIEPRDDPSDRSYRRKCERPFRVVAKANCDPVARFDSIVIDQASAQI